MTFSELNTHGDFEGVPTGRTQYRRGCGASNAREGVSCEAFLERYLKRDDLLFPRTITKLRPRWRATYEKYRRDHPEAQQNNLSESGSGKQWTSVLPLEEAERSIRPYIVLASQRVVEDIANMVEAMRAEYGVVGDLEFGEEGDVNLADEDD